MYRIDRLRQKNSTLVDAICETLKTAYDPHISRFFVQQDEGYKVFFKAVVEHPNYATYYVYHTETNELDGFACFQIIEHVIFLKHIVVNNKLRGSKIGTKLLLFALEDIQANNKGEYLFQLHVFEKNSKALSWYLSIGMQIADCNYWYDLYPTISALEPSELGEIPSFCIEPDNFGFKQLSSGDLYIGTLLADKTLIIKNQKALECLGILAGFLRQNNIESVGMVSDQPLPFCLIDKALLMSLPLALLECEGSK